MLYPSEADINGSEAAFAALWRVLLEKDSVAIVRYVRVDGAEPVFMALFPEREQVHAATGEQAMPPCLFGVTLPFQDELRSVPVDSCDRVAAGLVPTKRGLVQAADALVDSLTGPAYNVLDPALQISNPVLQSFYGALESVALDLHSSELAQGSVDHSSFESLGISLEAARALKEFAGAIPSGHGGGGAGSKRAFGEEGGSSRPAKKVRTSVYGEDEWRAKAEEGTLGKNTVEELKSGLTLFKLKLTGKKEDLIARLLEHLQ